jgi:alkylation response protein AidB-like acyl-CoA dehydrogenase
VLQAAMVIGAGERVQEMTANYAKDRVQFGAPIGRHQAVQYMVTDILIDVQRLRQFTLNAAWRIDVGLPFEREAARASAFACRAAAHIMRQAHEVHAGVAFMLEHDLQLYSRRAKHWEFALGDARYHEERMLVAAGI